MFHSKPYFCSVHLEGYWETTVKFTVYSIAIIASLLANIGQCEGLFGTLSVRLAGTIFGGILLDK